MRIVVLAALVALAPGLALAQQSPVTQAIGADWQAMATAQGHVAESVQKLIADLQAAQAENARLKAENDKLQPQETK